MRRALAVLVLLSGCAQARAESQPKAAEASPTVEVRDSEPTARASAPIAAAAPRGLSHGVLKYHTARR